MRSLRQYSGGGSTRLRQTARPATPVGTLPPTARVCELPGVCHVGIVIGIVVAVVVVLLVVFVIAGYNGLVRARNAYKNAFAQIDVQLRRRFDLIPNLVETAKTYMAHERQTLEAVVAARNNAMNGLSAVQDNLGDPAAMQQLAAGQQQLNGALAGSSPSPSSIRI